MIRKANSNDLNKIMSITKDIVKEMKEAKNPQWHDNYPTLADFQEDLENNSLYVYENKEVIGFIVICKDTNNEYEKVKTSTPSEAYIMHRLGIAKNFRKQGIAYELIKYAEQIARKNNVYLMKADTEINNFKMNNLFAKLGYQKLDTFKWSDNDGTYNYYEKRISHEKQA